MKKRLLCLCLPLLLSPFAFGCSAETKSVDRCSLAKELAKPSPIDVSNGICTFSGGNIGPFISGEDFKTTLDIEVKEAASYYVSIYFTVASKKTLVGGSNTPTSFPSSRRKRTFQVKIPKTLFISQDGGTFSVHVEASTGLLRGQKADFQVSLPLSSRGEVVNYDCESGPISFPNYLYYWSSPNLLSPSPLTFSLDGSSSKMALYKEQDNDTYDYLLISNVGVVIDYPANNGPYFKAELRLYDRFSDFPIAKTGDHIKIPMSHYFTFGGNVYGTHPTDNYYYSRTNLAMRGAGHHEENDIQSHVIFIPIGRGAIDVTYHYALYVYEVGYLENAFLIKGSFTRHWGHYGNPFLGDYYLSCGIGR